MAVFKVKCILSNGLYFKSCTCIVKAGDALDAGDKVLRQFNGDERVVNNELDIAEIKDTDILYISKR